MLAKLVQGERKAKLVWAFQSRSLTWNERSTFRVSARRVEYKVNREAFASIPNPQPDRCEAKTVAGIAKCAAANV